MEKPAALRLALMVADGGTQAGPNTATVLAHYVRKYFDVLERVEALATDCEANARALRGGYAEEQAEGNADAATARTLRSILKGAED